MKTDFRLFHELLTGASKGTSAQNLWVTSLFPSSFSIFIYILRGVDKATLSDFNCTHVKCSHRAVSLYYIILTPSPSKSTTLQ